MFSEHLNRMFWRLPEVEPARTGSSTRGTGLGLAIVKHAAHALGGSVRISSTVGVGTTVTCDFLHTLPEQGEAEAAWAKPARARPERGPHRCGVRPYVAARRHHTPAASG